jgi:hypothetical protein
MGGGGMRMTGRDQNPRYPGVDVPQLIRRSDVHLVPLLEREEELEMEKWKKEVKEK